MSANAHLKENSTSDLDQEARTGLGAIVGVTLAWAALSVILLIGLGDPPLYMAGRLTAVVLFSSVATSLFV